MNYKGSLNAPGYSYRYIGGDATQVVIPNEVMETNCLLEYSGEGFFPASLSEPVSCIVGAFHAMYHVKPGTYVHDMGIREGGSAAILAGAGPMGLGAIDYAVHRDRKPGLLVVTDIDQARLDRAAALLSPEEAARQGVKLVYVNTRELAEPEEALLALTGGKGFDDVFVFAPVRAVVEIGDRILGKDGCLNFFAGPTDPAFSAEVNFYNVHYSATHLSGHLRRQHRRHGRVAAADVRGAHQPGGDDHPRRRPDRGHRHHAAPARDPRRQEADLHPPGPAAHRHRRLRREGEERPAFPRAGGHHRPAQRAVVGRGGTLAAGARAEVDPFRFLTDTVPTETDGKRRPRVEYAIGVLDIGKTNKRLLVYDPALRIVESTYASFPEVAGDGEVRLENTGAIREWMLESLARFAPRYPLRALSVSTHGAAFACLDEAGEPAVPVVSYTTEPGEAFHRDFYARMGDADRLQERTFAPRLSCLLNIAQGIDFVQHRWPEAFRRTKALLGFPQYFGCLLTGRTGVEPTYFGSHTYLLDYRRGGWSEVAGKLGIMDLLPQTFRPSWEVLGVLAPAVAARTGLAAETLVTMGIHDSNAALLPYLLKHPEGFVLNSTGTWCVVMHPGQELGFGADEIGKVVFFNQDVFGRPVKTAIFMAGQEYDTYRALFRQTAETAEVPPFDPALYARLIRERRQFILPGVTPGTGQFPDSTPRIVDDEQVIPLAEVQAGRRVPAFLRDPRTAYAVLNLSLAFQTRVALRRAGTLDGEAIFTEGGFRKNEDYNALVRGLFPRSEVFLTNLEEASAFGAALLAKAAFERRDIRELGAGFEIERRRVPPCPLEGLEAYGEALLARIG